MYRGYYVNGVYLSTTPLVDVGYKWVVSVTIDAVLRPSVSGILCRTKVSIILFVLKEIVVFGSTSTHKLICFKIKT